MKKVKITKEQINQIETAVEDLEYCFKFYQDQIKEKDKLLDECVAILNEIRARDGVPYMYSGYKSSICPDYFSGLVDRVFENLKNKP